ncbi:CapA family protein [Pandoraea sp. NPDC090278]|uniref:CapA family protein n=1 Tax=Pandoraea sp. NPDC090278 TaxID=3364391 RepID=UPI00383B0677
MLAAHWGYEHEHWPNNFQRTNAYKLIEMGVDVIFGHSPHAVQPIELISVDGFDRNCPTQLSRGGNPRQAIILYSVGNSLSNMIGREAKSGILPKLRFIISKNANEVNLEIASIELMPIKTQKTKNGYIITGINNQEKYFWRNFFTGCKLIARQITIKNPYHDSSIMANLRSQIFSGRKH